jgi:hypothetical protein
MRMELGDRLSDRTERPPVDVALDKLNTDFTELVDLIEAGGLDQVDAARRWRCGSVLRRSGTGSR